MKAKIPAALFTHAVRPPEVHKLDDDQRYFGGNTVISQHMKGANVTADVMRFASHGHAYLSIDTYIHQVITTSGRLQLTADQCRLLACALLDAEHDLRTVAATKKEEVAA